jgi:hypothetical protein
MSVTMMPLNGDSARESDVTKLMTRDRLIIFILSLLQVITNHAHRLNTELLIQQTPCDAPRITVFVQIVRINIGVNSANGVIAVPALQAKLPYSSVVSKFCQAIVLKIQGLNTMDEFKQYQVMGSNAECGFASKLSRKVWSSLVKVVNIVFCGPL